MARVAVVTGASSGIGAATARRLADEGWDVVLVARRRERLDALADDLGGATVVAVDLTDEGACAAVQAAVASEHGGRVDLLVNNAGARWPGTFAETGVAGLREHLELNLFVVAELTHALLPALRRQHGAVVTLSSVSGFISRAGTAGYSTAKAAVRAWSDTLALEEPAIHVGLVVPGFIATEGFPQRQLVDNPRTRWLVSDVDAVASAIMRAGPGGQAQVHVPRPWALATAMRSLAPGVLPRLAALLGAQTTPDANSVRTRPDPVPDPVPDTVPD